jgi:hypothetical protein
MMKRYNVTFVLDTCTITTTIDAEEVLSQTKLLMAAADCINADLGLWFDVMDHALDTIVEEL